MDERDYLRSFLYGESKAYGFTISFWGSGVLLVNEFGLPGLLEALSYGAGAVTGFGLLALILFRNVSTLPEDTKNAFMTISMLHYIASLLPMIAAHIIGQNTSIAWAAFFLTGVTVSVVYNTLSAVEEDIAELVNKLK